MHFHKYFRVFANTWGETLSYRLNFVMWRFRTVLQLLTMFFLWSALIPQEGSLFGYTQTQMLTYILGTSLISSIVIATRTSEIGEQINQGDLSNFLLKPMSYMKYWFARDLGDKAMNLLFSVIEISLLIAIFQPSLFLQTNFVMLFFTLLAALISMVMYFFFNYLLGLFGFWSNEIWGPRFIFWILINFFAGSLFPLDILPNHIFEILKFLPFTYLLYFPIKIYLGTLSIPTIIEGLLIASLWALLLYGMVRFTWNKGLKLYGAEGK